MPELEEGSILYMPTTLPGMPSREAGWILQEMDRKLKEFPEVARVFGKLGRADTATDPAPMTMVESTVLLKPESEWRAGYTKEMLVAEMDEAMQMVGFVNAWTQPIATRIAMQDTGIQTPVGIKVKGPDLEVIAEIAGQVESALRTFPGTASVIAERVSEGFYVDVQNDLSRLAEHGVTVDEATLTARYAVGGENVVAVVQADGTVVPLSIQYSPEYIDTLDKVRKVPVISAGGKHVPLEAIADVAVRELPEMIRNDNGDRAGYVFVDLQGVTGVDYVARAQPYLAEQISLPEGYSLEWTGAHRYAEEAKQRLWLVVPVTLLITFLLLMLAFRSWAESIVDHAFRAFRACGRRAAPMVSGVPDHDSRDHWLRRCTGDRGSNRHHHGRVHSRFTRAAHGGATLHRCGDRRIGCSPATEVDDGGYHRSRAHPDHVGQRLGIGRHATHRCAERRRHDQLDDLRADPHSVLVRHRPRPAR